MRKHTNFLIFTTIFMIVIAGLQVNNNVEAAETVAVTIEWNPHLGSPTAGPDELPLWSINNILPMTKEPSVTVNLIPGTYQVVVKNISGEDIFFTVNDDFSLSCEESFVSIAGTTLSINPSPFTIEWNPPPTVYWYIRGIATTENDVISVNLIPGVYLIESTALTESLSFTVDEEFNAYPEVSVVDGYTIHILGGVVNQPPVANAGLDQSAHVGDSLTFDGSASYDPDGVITSYDWLFGDGEVASGITVSHAYTSADTYTVTLTVTDNEGATGSDTALARIGNIDPSATIGQGTIIETGVIIKENVIIGDNTVIHTGVKIKKDVQVGNGCEIGVDTEIKENTTIGDGVQIGEGCSIKKDVQVGNGCEIGVDTEIKENTTIGDGVQIGEACSIKENVTIGNDVIIGTDVKIGENTNIGSNVNIGNDVFIGENVEIGEGATISDGSIIPAGTVIPPGEFI